jgi:hypothetical protein
MPQKHETKQGVNPQGHWSKETLQEAVRRIQAENSVIPRLETEPHPSASDHRSRDPETYTVKTSLSQPDP